MKKRPLAILAVSAALFISPLWIMGQIMVAQYMKYDLWVFPDFTHNLQALFLLLLSLIVGFGVYSVKKWGFHLLIVFSLFTIINNVLLQYLHKTVFPSWGIIVCNVAVLGVMIIFSRREIYSPYFNPDLRWWEQARRFYCPDMHIDVFSVESNQKLTEATAFDISESGFYAVHEPDFEVGQKFIVNIHFSSDFIITAEAESVWRNSGTANLPAGYGCRFIKTKSSFRKVIRREIKNISLRLRERN